MKYDMVMVVQHGKSADVDGEDFGQLFHAIDNPLATMFIAFTGIRIHATEKGTAHATRNTMILGGDSSSRTSDFLGLGIVSLLDYEWSLKIAILKDIYQIVIGCPF
jgi:hypothetical protein